MYHINLCLKIEDVDIFIYVHTCKVRWDTGLGGGQRPKMTKNIVHVSSPKR